MQTNIPTLILSLTALVLAPYFCFAQTPNINETKSIDSPIPSVLKFSGSVREIDGKIKSGICGMTFALYRDESGGAPLWIETQTVTLDSQGRFTVILGSVSSAGVPADIFTSGEPRWVGITPDDTIERPRTLLTTVPYAFKASNADRLGGKSAEEFVSRDQLTSLLNTGLNASAALSSGPVALQGAVTERPPEPWPPNPQPPIRPFLEPQTFPSGILLPANKLETNAPGVFDSAPLDFESSAPDSQTAAPAKQRFRWSSQSLVAATSGPTAQLSLLFGKNGTTPAKTGFALNSDGTINFAPGQLLPSDAVFAALSGNQTGGSGSGSDPSKVPIVNTSQYPWSLTPQWGNALKVGTNEITLTPCPRGVNGTDRWHYLYVSGTGTPEVVLITGGSCVSRAASGTIQFTANYEHAKGYVIGTATDGVQEAVIDADVPGTNGAVSRQVLIDPGTHLLRARTSILSSGLTLFASGATLNCAMSDTCIMAGDPNNPTWVSRIVLRGLRVSAGVPGGTWPAVEDNANGSTIDDFGPATSPTPGGSFGSLIQIDNDQASTINGLDTNLAPWSKCDTTFCSTAIVGPGPYGKNAGVIWVKNSNLSLQCAANGIDNQNSNTLNISDSVIQAYPQFGVRGRTAYAPTTATMSGVYMEVGNCKNPLGTGTAGLIVEGGQANVTGGAPAGLLPQFANTGATGYYYYIVAHSSIMGTSSAYMAGYAITNGSGPINVLWNQIGKTGIITYDVLRITGDGGADMSAPFGSGLFAVAVGLPATTACSNKVCSFVDDAAFIPSSYTVADVTPFWPSLSLWPGSVILTSAFDIENQGGSVPTQYSTDKLPGSDFGGIVASAGASAPSVNAQVCDPQASWSSIWMQCVGGNALSNDYPKVTATVLQLSSVGGAPGGLKGRLIFEVPPLSSLGATHVITLSDSNPDKTMSTTNNRPSWDPNDTYLGYDQPVNAGASKTQLSFGSPVAISNYIGNPGDGIHFLERLTSSRKVFNVPVQVPQVLTGSALNTDAAGVIDISTGTSGAYPFSGTYTISPSCTLTPLSDPTASGAYWATITTKSLTANVKSPGVISFTYHCWGRS
jgi:hypothetical protein